MSMTGASQQPVHDGDITPPKAKDGAMSPSASDMEKPRDVFPAEELDNAPVNLTRPYILAMTAVVSLGGLIFGYDTGQISGFLAMPNFLYLFHNELVPNTNPQQYAFSDVRSGTIVALLSIGTLLGALLSKPVADKFGRRVCIVFWNIIFCIGVIVQISTPGTQWYQIAIGRLVAGFGVGGLSVLTPMYQSETAPRQIRGAMVSTYQLFITLGILLADLINLGTEKLQGKQEWRIPMGIGFVWPFLMAVGICLLPESPRWDYRNNNIERARRTVARSYGVSINHPEVQREMREIKEKYDAETANGAKIKWHGVVTAPRMAYRTGLGVVLQALQQLTGANFFFYYGTTVFESIGLSNSFITASIFGAINFAMTFPGLYVVEKAGRRKALMLGAAWMFMCFMVFSSVGHFVLDYKEPRNTPNAGIVLIVFASIFIAGYAMTWGPVVWVVVGEMFPTQYRAMAMGISSASNWIWNFLIAFFTPFITNAIDFRLGYIFAACNFIAIPIVYFFLEEHQGRTLEEIDTMYVTRVKPWQSSKWQPDANQLVTSDEIKYASGMNKSEVTGMRNERHVETVSATGESNSINGDGLPKGA